jgi:HD-GYP domain-containing protein (c-di-GMP phosphodiesterase class II)
MEPAPPQTDALALVREVTAAVASTHDVDEVLKRVVRLTGEALDVTECDIYELDARARHLTATATWNLVSTPEADSDWLGETIDIDAAIEYRQALEAQEPVEEHVDDPGLSRLTRDVMDQWGEKSWLIVPLIFGARPIGALMIVEHRSARRFTDDERELAVSLAVPAAIAIHNARLHRRMAEQNRFLGSLVDSSRAITASVDLDEVLMRVAREACEALDTSQSAVYVHDPEREGLIYQVAHERVPTQGPDAPTGEFCPFSEYPGERAILFADDVVVEYCSDPTLPEDRRRSLETWNEKSVLSVPLRFRDARLGILRLYDFEQERTFTPLELQLAGGLGELAGAALHNAQSYRREQARNLELETLLEATTAMASSMELDDVLGRLAQRAGVALGSPQCLIYEHDAEHDSMILRSVFDAHGVDPDAVDKVGNVYPLADYPSDRETLRRGEVVEEHISDPATAADVRASMLEYGEKACLTVPLVFRGRSLGLMELIESERERHFTASEIRLARALAEQAAVALNNARLYHRSQEYAARLESSYLETVTALAAAMEAKDHYTADHADMLAMMAVAVGRSLGLSERELRDLQFASVLHDIGKIGIPGNILNKPDKLTDEEFAVMAEHTIIGERIISAIDYLAPIGKAIRAAHERWDGRGYPDGLAGESIPRPARILFVCDAFHAMTSDRPYRKALPDEVALEELRSNAGRQFDPEVVEAFLGVWPHFEAAEVAPQAPNLN